MSAFVLKIIACISMLLCHIPFVFSQLAIPLIYIGKLAFPIYAFLISEGYAHTKSFSKYLVRLLFFAIISQIPAMLLFEGKNFTLYFNIFFTLAFGLLGIRVFDKIEKKYISYPLIALLAVIANLLGFDYGAIGVLMIVCFYVFKNHKMYMVLSESLLMIALYVHKLSVLTVVNVATIRYVLFQLLFSIISLLFILFYNGKRGKNSKAIQLGFYLFYPLHLFILCLLKYIVA